MATIAFRVKPFQQALLEQAIADITQKYQGPMEVLEAGACIDGNHRNFIRQSSPHYEGLDPIIIKTPSLFDQNHIMDFLYWHSRKFDFIFGIHVFDRYRYSGSSKWIDDIIYQFKNAVNLALRGVHFQFIMDEEGISFNTVKKMLDGMSTSGVHWYKEDDGAPLSLATAKQCSCLCAVTIVK